MVDRKNLQFEVRATLAVLITALGACVCAPVAAVGYMGATAMRGTHIDAFMDEGRALAVTLHEVKGECSKNSVPVENTSLIAGVSEEGKLFTAVVWKLRQREYCGPK